MPAISLYSLSLCCLFRGGVLGALEIFLDVHAYFLTIGGIVIDNLLVDGCFGLIVFLLTEHGGFLHKESGSVVRIVVGNLHSLLVAVDSLGIFLEVHVAVAFK